MTLQIKDILKTMDYGPAPEARDEVSKWLSAAPKAGFGHYIGGKFTTAKKGGTFAVTNPASDEELAQVALGTAADVEAAVKAAKAAFPAWSGLDGHERARYLYALARHIQKHSRFLAVLETMDNGKTIRETRDIDVPLVARHFYHHAGWAELLETDFEGYKPVGVCGQIIPWNFPLLMLAWKIAPALAAGNTVVLKPAEQTPLTAIAFAEICHEIGLPDGVVNIVQGDGSTGSAICKHPDIAKVAFTGSTDVGRIIRDQTAGSGKKLSLELGGKSPFIVFPDADLDAAVEGVVDAIWFNQGEVCCAGSRVLVQEGIAELFFDKLRARMKTLRVGDPLDKTMDVGALVSHEQRERIGALVETGKSEGATLWQYEGNVPSKGSFCRPGFFTGSEAASTVSQEEIFGPIAVTMTFRTPAEAVEIANNTRYGLAASIWTENINLAVDVAAQVKAGIVWINETNIFDAGAGFGGYRESGFGREGGREGLYEYLKPQWESAGKPRVDEPLAADGHTSADAQIATNDGIDRTPKLYVGGKQARPDSGYSYAVRGKNGAVIGHAGLGNRKDIRNAVEAATKAAGWGASTGHNRAQILYYLGENLSARKTEFSGLLSSSAGVSTKAAAEETDRAIRRIFWYAAYADKYDGAVHATQSQHVTIAMNEPWGVMGVVCPDEMPLLSLVSLTLPALAMGNCVVVVPSQRHPLLATNLYQVIDTSDVPAGVFNIVTGERDVLADTLAKHDGVDALWYCGSAEGGRMVEKASAGNLKAVWSDGGLERDWRDMKSGQGREYLRRATQVKNIWLPYGE